MAMRKDLPVGSFTTNEYIFYKLHLACDDLHQEAGRAHEIRPVLAKHIQVLEYVQASVFVTPLIFPGNLEIIPPLRKNLKDRRKPGSVHSFLSYHRMKFSLYRIIMFFFMRSAPISHPTGL